ncbi:hypothetical protein JHK87_010249 [Glycine soja]|nr:hypothetical protein JHK87_010249 [Glycine soja]
MARVPDKIKLIDGSRETLKLSVRITDLWFIGIPEKFEQAEMVVVDSDVSGSSQLSSKDVFLSKAKAKNISQINAISEGEQTKFLLWDRECAELIGQSADEVNRLKIEDGDVDLNASPQALDTLLGCFLAFKVKVQLRFRNVVVLKYSDESDLINVVQDMLPDTEQSVSVTADHDPLLKIPLTPTKRVSSDELDDGPKNFEISPAEVSSNKLAKLCQPE